jgi:hypothetical protein
MISGSDADIFVIQILNYESQLNRKVAKNTQTGPVLGRKQRYNCNEFLSLMKLRVAERNESKKVKVMSRSY